VTEALTGRFTDHHAFLARVHLDLIDQHTAAIDDITLRIEATIKSFHGFRDLICTIPGISTRTADVIIAETGADMSRFATAGHLASRAGTTPGNNESAGKVKSSRTRPGNPYLQGALGRRRHVVCPKSKHLPRRPLPPDRLTSRTTEGQRRNPTLNADRHLAHGNQRFPLRRSRRRLLQPTPPRASEKRAINQLQAMGYQVTLTHAS
jgi:transposase